MSTLPFIPLLPLAAAGLTALMPRGFRKPAAATALLAQTLATVLAFGAFVRAVGSGHGEPACLNFDWLAIGQATLRLGFVLDPLGAGMALMVSFVSLLIFIYSIGYMAHDPNFTRFFCFLSLFSGAMLGVVLSNSLLLTFACWELVGLASYLLIGFWFQKPEAAAAAKKAFLTTRVGDMGFLLGMLWLYSSTGTLLFFDGGRGCLEASAVSALAAQTVGFGMAASNAIALLIFCGAAGKSGQLPLHVWLPDAMEGPTPVSALIHAATMVAAGVFLVARAFPLFEAAGPTSAALVTVAWTGAATALFAALIAIAQTDIKRILAYSTVSQLGFMMLALGVGSVPAAMVHLIAHAFFKALLFLGAGSVIHGVHDEQDIRKMGGLRVYQPITFLTYAIGMMALSGVPFFFSGFWSKDEILHIAHGWPVSHLPFFMAAAAAFLTAFYMTRQMCYVFAGSYRGKAHPHESPAVMTLPLVVLAGFAVFLSIPLTPAWPWLHGFHEGHAPAFDLARLVDHGFLTIAGLSILLAGGGIGLGLVLYRKFAPVDPLERAGKGAFRLLERRFLIDELYAATVIRAFGFLGRFAAGIDRAVFIGAMSAAGVLVRVAAAVSDFFDRMGINLGFDSICGGLKDGGELFSSWQGGRAQSYLRILAAGAVLLLAFIGWLMS